MYNRKVLIDSLKKLGSAKVPPKKKDMIIDPRGQWAHPGQNTRIPSNNITMDNVPYPVYADPNVGPSRMMYPEQEYNFPGADYVDEYPQMKSGGNKHDHVIVKPSKIEGADKGLFSNQGFRKDQLIGLAHRDGQPVGHIGNMHNHSDEPNMYSIKKGNERYVYAKRDIQPGEELTTDYRQQPELEQPEDFMRKGGSAPKLPKKKNSKAYSRSLEATNRLFAEHPFFAQPKSRKNKIYDPNAKYYQKGGLTGKGANVYFNPTYMNNFTGGTNSLERNMLGSYRTGFSPVVGIEGSLSKSRRADEEKGRGWLYNAYAGLNPSAMQEGNFMPSAGVNFDFENAPQDKNFRPHAQIGADYNPDTGLNIGATTGARFPFTPYGNKRIKPGYATGHLDIYGGARAGMDKNNAFSGGLTYGARVHGKYMPERNSLFGKLMGRGAYLYGDAGLQFDPQKGKIGQKLSENTYTGVTGDGGTREISNMSQDPGLKFGNTVYANVGIKKEIDDIKFKKDNRARKIRDIEEKEGITNIVIKKRCSGGSNLNFSYQFFVFNSSIHDFNSSLFFL
jgi:hypothetical protein